MKFIKLNPEINCDLKCTKEYMKYFDGFYDYGYDRHAASEKTIKEAIQACEQKQNNQCPYNIEL